MAHSRSQPTPLVQPESGEQLLPLEFYCRPTPDVARDLLGMILLHETAEGSAGGRIVETEAYLGAADPASHAARRVTPRNHLMFEAPGHAYVYFIYGNNWCFNAVAFAEPPGAVLIRGLEPLWGIERMRERRGHPPTDRQLTNGPGKLAKALAIARAQNGAALYHPSSPLRIARGERPAVGIEVGPRIGIRSAQHLPLRFHERGSTYVSKL